MNRRKTSFFYLQTLTEKNIWLCLVLEMSAIMDFDYFKILLQIFKPTIVSKIKIFYR